CRRAGRPVRRCRRLARSSAPGIPERVQGSRSLNLNVVLPLCSSLLSFLFFVFLADQWRERRRAYQLVWAIGMLWYGISAGTEFLGGAFGWSEPLYRVWYLIGAVLVAG